MWYVFQTFTGKEQTSIIMCRKIIAKEGERLFMFHTEIEKKFHGEFQNISRPLFPGYVFFETNDATDFYLRLNQVPTITKVLRTGTVITPIKRSEEKFLKEIGGYDHIVRPSRGFIKGDKVIITEGSFKGWQGIFKYIDRHKRMAIIEISFCGKPTEVMIGLEIFQKLP